MDQRFENYGLLQVSWDNSSKSGLEQRLMLLEEGLGKSGQRYAFCIYYESFVNHINNLLREKNCSVESGFFFAVLVGSS